MEIKDYQKGDEIEILKLFKRTFKKEMNPKYWEWRFANNPSGNWAIKLMWEDDLLIGHYATSPTNLVMDDQIVKGSLSMTTMTHPEYTGKGIFKMLANALYNDLESIHGHHFVMGFPNLNSHYGFIKNLKWQNLAVQNHITYHYKRGSSRNTYQIRLAQGFDSQHSEILEKTLSKNSKVHTHRSLEYLRWRYDQNPNNKYRIFECYLESEFIGLLVVKEYLFTDTGAVEYFIVENGLGQEHVSAIPDVLDYICKIDRLDELTISTWLSPFDDRFIHYEKVGFIFVEKKPTLFCIKPYHEKFPLLEDYRNWSLSYGDSDVY